VRVVVIGGTGFLGAKTVAALARFPGLEVEVASRRGPLVVDVSNPASFSALESAEVLIDLSDGTRARPDALAAWALENGKTLIEATSDAETVRRLRERHSASTGPGRLVLGGGIFTGVSNVLARTAAERAGEGSTLTWAVASSPYSGAGKGTIALMVEAAARPAVKTVDGRREEAPLTRGPTLDFAGTQRPTLEMSLAEAEMLPFSTKANTVRTFFAPKPGFLVAAFAAVPAFLLRRRWFRWLLEGYFVVLRRVLLSRVPSSVQMVARAERAGQTVVRTVTCHDGMEAGAWALAAMAESIGRAPPRPGLTFIDDDVRLEPLLARIDEVAGHRVFTLTGS